MIDFFTELNAAIKRTIVQIDDELTKALAELNDMNVDSNPTPHFMMHEESRMHQMDLAAYRFMKLRAIEQEKNL
jgi:hypothetical protein